MSSDSEFPTNVRIPLPIIQGAPLYLTCLLNKLIHLFSFTHYSLGHMLEITYNIYIIKHTYVIYNI